VRSVISSFSHNNLNLFHAVDGSGYRFLAEEVLIADKSNPQLAARLVTPLTDHAKFTAPYCDKMLESLKEIKSAELSEDLAEIVKK
jgi:aminopeptidase N